MPMMKRKICSQHCSWKLLPWTFYMLYFIQTIIHKLYNSSTAIFMSNRSWGNKSKLIQTHYCWWLSHLLIEATSVNIFVVSFDVIMLILFMMMDHMLFEFMRDEVSWWEWAWGWQHNSWNRSRPKNGEWKRLDYYMSSESKGSSRRWEGNWMQRCKDRRLRKN